MIIYGRNTLLTALEANQYINEIWISSTSNGPTIKKISTLAKSKSIQISFKNPAIIDKKAGTGVVHQGVLGVLEDFKYQSFQEHIEHLDLSTNNHTFVLLDQINDPHNLGAIIRTAECAGISAIMIPKHNSAQVTSSVIKVSAGATFYLPIIKTTTLEDVILDLKNLGFKIVITDGEAETNLYEPDYNCNVALIIGNEGTGIRKKIKNMANERIKIPITGKTESLNASVAAGICMYHIKSKQLK